MAKNALILFILAGVLVAGLAWQTTLKNAAALRVINAQLQAQNQKQQGEIETLRQKVKDDEALLASKQATVDGALSALQQQLAIAQAHVLDLAGKTNQARADRERLEHVLQTGGEAQLADQIHHDQVELKQLDDQTRDSKLTEQGLKGEQNQALAQQKQSHSEALAEIKTQIQQQQLAIKQTQQQISSWQKRKRDVNQPNQLQTLGDQLTDQKGQLAALQNQAGLIQQDERIQSQVVKETTAREKSEEQSQQTGLEERKKSLKADLQALQQKKSTNDRDQAGLKAQVQRARDQEKALQDQIREAQKTVRQLQSQIETQQTEGARGQTSGQMPQ